MVHVTQRMGLPELSRHCEQKLHPVAIDTADVPKNVAHRRLARAFRVYSDSVIRRLEGRFRAISPLTDARNCYTVSPFLASHAENADSIVAVRALL